jgi:signal transduction histidine kinase
LAFCPGGINSPSRSISWIENVKTIEWIRRREIAMRVVRSSAVVLTTAWLAMASIPVFAGPGEESVMPEKILKIRKKAAVLAVNLAAQGLGGQCAAVADQKKWIRLIRAFIDPIRFYPDGSGYFYVYNYNCVNIAHATQKNLVGKDLSDFKDEKGKFVIRELVKAARKGGGFVEYYWIKPGAEGEHLKIGYVEPIPGTNCFIGTGVYLDHGYQSASGLRGPDREITVRRLLE